MTSGAYLLLQFGYGHLTRFFRAVHRSTVTSVTTAAPLELTNIVFERGERRILDDVSLRVADDEHWVVLGANGSGKTTLLRIGAMYEHPSSGGVRVLGEELGHTDVRQLRRRVGYASAALASQFRPALTGAEIVMTAKYAALEPWWHRYDDIDRARAEACLERMGVGALADRSLATMSSGEQQRVFIARTLMNEPGVILLDEPSARLDLGGREQLVAALAELASHREGSPFVLVTHHVDEVPAGVSHALLLTDGQSVASGPIEEALTADTLSDCFSMPLALERRPDGRLSAWARR
jgi:iron complex transport system ATP-binding protein